MKTSYFIAVLALLGLTVEAAKLNQVSFSRGGRDDDNDVDFNKFVSKFSRNYRTKGEYSKRLNNYRKNKKIVEEENAKGEGYELELNKLSDLDNHEYQTMFGLVIPDDEPEVDNKAEFLGLDEEELLAEQTPTSIDWVAKGAVGPIRNQGSCGSCYSFSALSAIESAYYIKSKVKLDLSEQQVVDCSGNYGNQGCNGGWMDYVFKYAKATKLATETQYPYTKKKGTCKTSIKGSYGTTGYVDVTRNSPSALQAAVA
jgi:cathepsin L